MAKSKNMKNLATDEVSGKAPSSAAMQDLFKKMQTEGSSPVTPAENRTAAPQYDEDRAVSTRKQLMEDYRRELEELGKDEKRASSRPNLYEYEDLSVDVDEEPAVKEEKIVEIAEEPAEVVEESTEAEEEPVEVVEEPAEAEEEPVEVVEEPTEAEEEPAEVVEEPTEAEEEPVEVVEEPTEAEEEPTEAEEEPVEVIEESTEAEEEPVEVVEEPTEAEEEPAEVVEEPIEVEEEPIEVEEEPAEAEEEPVEVVEESVEVEEEPVEVVEEPIEAAEEPTEVAEEPAEEEKTSFRPVATFRQPDVQEKKTAPKIPPSKQKDPYSVYDYDMAQDFGYIPVSRAKTVSQANEMEEAPERHITIFMKSESDHTEEPKEEHEKRGRVLQRRSDPREDHEKRTKQQREKNADRSSRKRTIPEPERVSVTEDARIRDNPKKEKDNAFWRMIATGSIAVVLLFWEYLPLIPGSGYLLFGIIGNTQYPFLYIGIAAGLLLISTAILGPSIGRGFLDMVLLRCTPRSLTAFAVTAALLNDLFSVCILILDPAVEYGMFHYPAAIFVSIYAIGNYATVCRKGDTYTVFGAMRVKYLLTDDGLCERVRNRARKGSGEDGGRMRRLTVKNEVLGVENRLNAEERYDSFPGFRKLFFLLILLGMVAMLVSAFLTAGSASLLSRMAEAVRAFLWTVFLTVPLAVTELRRIPLMKISEKMRKKNTALAGDAAASEYATVGRVAVRSEFFLRKHAFCFGECLGDDPIRLKFYMSSIFAALGEPFSKAVLGGKDGTAEPYTEDVKLVLISERIVRAYVEGVLVELRLNDNERAGYRLSDAGAPKKESAYRLPLGIAVEGESVGTCSVYAQNDSEYPALTRALHEHGLGVEVCHYTFLSFFNEKTLQILYPPQHGKVLSVVNLTDDTVADRLLKSDIREDATDSGIAALNTPKDLWLPLVYAEKIVAYNRFAAATAWGAVILGAVLSILTVSGVFSAGIFPVLAVLLPIAFGIFTYFFSNYFLS